MTAKIVNKKNIISGNWLELETLTYTDAKGQIRQWETVSRKNGFGAACIIAALIPSGRIILVRQFRPPAGGYVIEFPAGLIDQGENPESTALRELTEETGYTGKIIDIAPASHSSPGLSGECVNLVFMEVDENTQGNLKPETDFDDGEHIETFLVKLDEMTSFLSTRQEEGDLMDAKVMTFAKSIIMCSKFNIK